MHDMQATFDAIIRVVFHWSLSPFLRICKIWFGHLSLCFNSNPVFPGILKTNEIPGGLQEPPPMKNNEGVFLGPYHQKTFWKGTNFRLG